MEPLRRFLHAAIAETEQDLDLIGRALGPEGSAVRRVRLLAYAGYRTAERLHLKGRIVRFGEPLTPGGSLVGRLRAMMDIYNSRELPAVPVRLTGYGQVLDAITDEEGYFAFEAPIDQALPEATRWESVTLSTPDHEAQQPSVVVPVLAPGTNHNWGIISDIDDTVVETGATNFVKNWRRVLVETPSERLAVPGAATLYRTIAQDHANPVRPFFYVSSSPWNLYGFLTEFMELNGIPHGPMFLKDYGIDREQLIGRGHDVHKLEAIGTILAAYPDFKFLLIGDNGQADVGIYARVAAEYRDRVAAVFIRDVDGSCRSGPEGEMLRGIEALGIATFCGAGWDDAVALVARLELDRPLEAAKAVLDPDPAATVHT